MSSNFKGGVVSATPPTITAPTAGEGGSASGIWDIDNVFQEEGGSTWPKPPIVGQLWMWGRNNYGQLGQGNTTSESSPVQVGSLTDWAKANSGMTYNVYSTKGDGTGWAWGYNSSGILGLGDTTARSSPVQIGALTNWSEFSGGIYQAGAVKTDGTIWVWGVGGSGA